MDKKKTDLLILAAEDNEDDWADLEKMLIDSRLYASHQIHWKRCRSMSQLLEVLACNAIDIILLDLKLIDSPNPLETTRKVAEVADPRGIPIVVVSGVDDDVAIARKCGSAGAYHHLQKGRFDMIDLLRAIELSYGRATELRRQRDRFLNAERKALENLELADRATSTLDQLRTDLHRFARNEKHRKIMLSVAVAAGVFLAMPSVNERRFTIQISDSSLSFYGFALATIWGSGAFRERLSQGQEAADLLVQVRSRKDGD